MKSRNLIVFGEPISRHLERIAARFEDQDRMAALGQTRRERAAARA